MSVEQVTSTQTKIAEILAELGEPTAEDMAELRRLLPPVATSSNPTMPAGTLGKGGGRRRR